MAEEGKVNLYTQVYFLFIMGTTIQPTATRTLTIEDIGKRVLIKLDSGTVTGLVVQQHHDMSGEQIDGIELICSSKNKDCITAVFGEGHKISVDDNGVNLALSNPYGSMYFWNNPTIGMGQVLYKIYRTYLHNAGL